MITPEEKAQELVEMFDGILTMVNVFDADLAVMLAIAHAKEVSKFIATRANNKFANYYEQVIEALNS
jgi:hypothetical protein